MDLTGSIADATAPLSTEVIGSLVTNATGSSAIDTVVGSLAFLPKDLLAFVAGVFNDLGSTLGDAIN